MPWQRDTKRDALEEIEGCEKRRTKGAKETVWEEELPEQEDKAGGSGILDYRRPTYRIKTPYGKIFSATSFQPPRLAFAPNA